LSETYHTNLVGSPWILEPICRIYLTTHSPNYISLAIYFSTYQLPKLACLLTYLSTSYGSLFTCSPIINYRHKPIYSPTCFQLHYNNLFTHLRIYLAEIAYSPIYLSITNYLH
jgi:hypothetical protein